MASSSYFPISPTTTVFISSKKSNISHNFQLTLFAKKSPFVTLTKSATDNGAGNIASPTPVSTVEEKKIEKKEEALDSKEEEAIGSNGIALKNEAIDSAAAFKDPRWVKGNWNLSKFEKNDKTDWDAVIDAEARRRKWLQDNPETSNNNEPVVFDSSIIPWWAWIKRYHLPEAELLNGRAAMIGFFMAYFVDSLTGVGLVDQMGNFFCKTLLFIAVAGVLLIRKNEDVESLKKLFDEITFYDKQWQATWQEDTTSNDSKNK